MQERSKNEFTRTGARRSGDDYQDIVAIDIFVEWLEHPERFQRVKLEDDESGYLDDIRAERSDGIIELKQVKFSTNPDDPSDSWTFETLLSEREGKPNNEGTKKNLPSLISKWAKSVKMFAEAEIPFDAFVVSNRRAATDFSGALRMERLSYDKIADPAICEELIRQIGPEAEVRKFFSRFRFRIDQPSLEILENGARRRFFRLGGTAAGWLNFKDTVRAWMRRRKNPPPDGWITLTHVRRACLWNTLESLPQDIEIPADYVLPSATFHDDLIKNLPKENPAVHVIKGKPGVGKSTYATLASIRISRLLRHLRLRVGLRLKSEKIRETAGGNEG